DPARSDGEEDPEHADAAPEDEEQKDNDGQPDDRERPVTEVLRDGRVVVAGRVKQLAKLAHLLGLQAVDETRADLGRDLTRLERPRLALLRAAGAAPAVRDH